MYYSTDENGNIIMSESSDILPEEYQEIFPSFAPGSDYVTSGDISSSFSSDEFSDENPHQSEQDLSGYDFVTYDDMIDLLALVPGYNVYPSTAAVNVFEDVLNGLNHNIGYIILSGSDTNTTLLYYSDKFIVTGSSIVLSSPVTQCTYYQYRPTSSSNFVYTYSVSTLGDTTFNVTNQLVYTNLLNGYPDVLPYKQKETYSLFFVISFALFVLLIFFMRHIKGGRML